MKEWKNVVYMSLALGMLIYAVPRLDLGGSFVLPTVFGVVWLAFALLIVSAHLHRILGVDEETKQELNRVRKISKMRREQWIAGKLRVEGKK